MITMAADNTLNTIRHQKMAKIMSQTTQTFPENVINIESVDDFNELVNGYQENVIIVDFWAPWCGPCKAFGPTFEALQKEYIPKKVLFCKLNVDDLGSIAQQFQVSGIPTTLFIVGKKLVQRIVGMQNKPQFTKTIETVLAKIEDSE